MAYLTKASLLDLSANKLMGEIPEEIGNSMANLQMLYLGRNNLSSTLPSSLLNLQKLVTLGLIFNNFEGNILPFERISTLTKATLSYNNFYSLPLSLCEEANRRYAGWLRLSLSCNPIIYELLLSHGDANLLTYSYLRRGYLFIYYYYYY